MLCISSILASQNWFQLQDAVGSSTHFILAWVPLLLPQTSRGFFPCNIFAPLVMFTFMFYIFSFGRMNKTFLVHVCVFMFFYTGYVLFQFSPCFVLHTFQNLYWLKGFFIVCSKVVLFRFRKGFLKIIFLQASFFLVLTSRTCLEFNDFQIFHIHKKLR